MTHEEILRQSIPADCIWEESKHLVNTPFEYVYPAMDQYAKQESVSFAEWIAENVNSHYADGIRYWIMKFGPQRVVTTEELYALFPTRK
jgi:hypothetical protein